MAELSRYHRQILFPAIGEAGQRQLGLSRVLLCGCGALGTVLAETLVRAGVGFLRLVDRDFVELTNLQRQVLFDEQDLADQLPKAVAAARKLRLINSQVTVEPHVADVSPANVLNLATGVDLILDGTDNFETRFLLNDVSLELGIPWVYGGCIGSHGQVMPIFPGETACLRCLIEEVPAPGTTETCDTAGILGPTVNMIASLQAVQALKILSGHRDQVEASLHILDVWDGTLRKMSVKNLRDQGQCPACCKGERSWLHGDRASQTAVLCGRNAVQVSPAERRQIGLVEFAEKLRASGQVTVNPFLLRLVVQDGAYEITLFADARAIIKGTDDPSVAKSLYARYVGA
ncbi:MAG: moeB [Planctomycetaceae bacterium]|nr:moeB [Planctomycetaceae bacterium]